MKINNELKTAINKLQLPLVSETESDNILLIFDNQAELLKYKRKHKYMCPNELLITLDDLCYKSHTLDGLRYKQYYFMTDEEVK